MCDLATEQANSGRDLLLPNIGVLEAEICDSQISKMKEDPTMSLITRGRFSEPTMLLKANKLTPVSHDVTENKCHPRMPIAWSATKGRAQPRIGPSSGLVAQATSAFFGSADLMRSRNSYERTQEVIDNKRSGFSTTWEPSKSMKLSLLFWVTQQVFDNQAS